jgi:hypothetical protein
MNGVRNKEITGKNKNESKISKKFNKTKIWKEYNGILLAPLMLWSHF